MEESYLLGIDIGTSNVKVVLVDSDFHVVQKHSCPLVLEKVESEISVGHIFTALESCFQDMECCQQMKKVKAIGVCGQMHGCVLWDSHGVPLFNVSVGKLQHTDGVTSKFITWQDDRCTPAFLSNLPSISNQVHPPASAGYGCATLAWLQQNGDMLSKFDRAGTIMDMLVCALCSGGSSAVVMSSQNAASWGYFNVSASQWYKEMLVVHYLSH